jgi:hypothetical protein
MSFSNIGNDLYIYFKQENAKKNLFFSVAVFCGICFAQNTVMGKFTQGGASSGSHVHIGKNSILGCFWELSY